MTANLYNYFSGLQVSSTEIANAESLAQSVLAARYPDMDFREGTGLRDLVIRPSATLMALLQKALGFYFSQNTLQGVDNTTPQEFVDQLLSNWFLTRRSGSNSIINARLYFAKQKVVSIPLGVYFSTDGTLKFYPTTSISLPSSSLIFDSSSNEFYLDIDLVSESVGPSYNISSGSLLYFSNFDPYFLHAEINYLSQISIDTESNVDFVARAGTAISTRNLVNLPSIISNLNQAFPLLTRIFPKGAGDVEMVRDKILVNVPYDGGTTPTWIHNGGKVDTYCYGGLSTTNVQLTADPTGKVSLTGPIYKFVRSSVSLGEADTILYSESFNVINTNTYTVSVPSIRVSSNVGTVTAVNHGFDVGRTITISGSSNEGLNGSFRITGIPSADTFTIVTTAGDMISNNTHMTAQYIIPEYDVGFSSRQELLLDFGIGNAGGTVSFDVWYFEGVSGIQNYLEDPSNKVLCSDNLCRGFNMYSLRVSVLAYNSPAPDSNQVLSITNTYVNSLSSGQPFVISDLQTAIMNLGYSGIKTPIDVSFTYYTRDLLTPTVGVITDILDPNDSTAIFVVDSVYTSSTTI